MAAQDNTQFSKLLGQALSEWAESHPQKDEPIMNFVGKKGALPAMTPLQYAQEIIDQTQFGVSRTQYYLKESKNVGDPSGMAIIDDYRNLTSEQKAGKSSAQNS